LRDDARACLDAAIAAVDPEGLVARRLRDRPLPGDGPVHVAGIGKAAAAMARGARAVLGDRIAGGVLVVPEPADAAGLAVHVGGHPLPDDAGVRGARAIRDLARGLRAEDRLLLLVSGGGSALATLPPEGVALEDVRATTDLLLRAGADIGSLNSVRKHVDLLKGGRLARLAAPAQVTALVLSDVVGDPLDVIASGPVSPDPTTFADALATLARFDVQDATPAAIRRHLEAAADESPGPGDPCFETVDIEVVGNNRLAAEAAVAEARARGYEARLGPDALTGEAREAGRELGELARRIRERGDALAAPACVVAGGETTVTVRGGGRGGRNQEVALGAALVLDGLEGVLVLSAGTDGIDGPTDAAGAVATGDTVARGRARGLDARRALADNDAYPFFEALGDLVVTGPTGTNVMDLQIVLVA